MNLDNEYFRSHTDSCLRFIKVYASFAYKEKISYSVLNEEIANLNLAFKTIIDLQEREILIEFWYGVKDFLIEWGYWDVFLNWGKKTLINLPKKDWITRAYILADMGWVYMDQSYYEEAEKYFIKSEKLFNLITPTEVDIDYLNRGICAIVRYLGVLYYRMQKYEIAKTKFMKALDLSKKYNLKGMEAESYNLLGSLARKKGALLEAKDYYEKSLSIMKSINNNWQVPTIIRNISRLNKELGRLSESKQGLLEAIALCEEIGRKDLLFGCQLCLAEIEFELGNYDKSLNLTKYARKGFINLGMLTGIDKADNLLNLINNKI